MPLAGSWLGTFRTWHGQENTGSENCRVCERLGMAVPGGEEPEPRLKRGSFHLRGLFHPNASYSSSSLLRSGFRNIKSELNRAGLYTESLAHEWARPLLEQ